MLILIFIIGIIFFLLGNRLSRIIKSHILNVVIASIFAVISIPAFVYIIASLSSIYMNDQIWYIQFRTLSGTEYLSVLSAIFLGFISPKLFSLKAVRWNIFKKYVYFIYVFIIFSPFIISVLFPIGLLDKISNKWSGEVCMQSTRATCAPASLATVFKHYKINKTEKEIATSCYSNLYGTYTWYIIRFANENGLKAKCENVENLFVGNIKTPALVVVTIKRINEKHMIVLLDKKKDKLIIGDPLIGKVSLSKSDFNNEYRFEHLVIEVWKI